MAANIKHLHMKEVLAARVISSFTLFEAGNSKSDFMKMITNISDQNENIFLT